MKKITEKYAKRTKHIKFFLENLFSLKTLLRFVFYNIFVAAIGHTFYYAREIFTDENPYGISSLLYAQISCAIVIALAIVVYAYIGTYHIEAKEGSVASKDTIHSTVKLKGNYEMRTFFHEAGHAVMAYLQGCDTVSIDTTDKYVTRSSFCGMSSAALEKSILVSYAGAAAEEIIYGIYSSGSLTGENNDFQKAANDIRAYIVMTNSSYSKTFLDKGLNEEVIAQSKLLYDEAKAMILDHKFLVLALAKELREKRSMSYEEIIACLKKAEKLNPSEDYIKEFLCELL